MRPANISIATITWTRDENEAPLILDALTTLAGAGMPVAISDRGSPPEVVAAQLGFRIVAITGDYRCPVDQRHEHAGERTHRLRQLSQNVDGLVLASTGHAPQ